MRTVGFWLRRQHRRAQRPTAGRPGELGDLPVTCVTGSSPSSKRACPWGLRGASALGDSWGRDDIFLRALGVAHGKDSKNPRSPISPRLREGSGHQLSVREGQTARATALSPPTRRTGTALTSEGCSGPAATPVLVLGSSAGSAAIQGTAPRAQGRPMRVTRPSPPPRGQQAANMGEHASRRRRRDKQREGSPVSGPASGGRPGGPAVTGSEPGGGRGVWGGGRGTPRPCMRVSVPRPVWQLALSPRVASQDVLAEKGPRSADRTGVEGV